MKTMSYKEMRQIALGAARSYLRSMDINPLDVDGNGALAALDDICRTESSLIVYVWYHQINSDNQIKLFKQEWNKWRKDNS
jgi:hypothetical protein